MSKHTTIGSLPGPIQTERCLPTWQLVVIMLALIALYFPVYRELAGTLWQQEAYAHGPLIVLACIGLMVARRSVLLKLTLTVHPAPGLMLLLVGLAMLWIGVTRSFPGWMTASHIPVISGIILMLWGGRGLRVLWFPVLFLFFVIPLPGIFIEVMTWQMKEWIAMSSVATLQALGYPVARSGMIILMGQYQMLIADACSGLHSILSLSALGMLYAYVSARQQPARAVCLLLSVIPIAMAVNGLRTLILLLMTFHHGDAVGRYWHDLTGTVMFLMALALLLVFDKSLVVLFRGRHR